MTPLSSVRLVSAAQSLAVEEFRHHCVRNIRLRQCKMSEITREDKTLATLDLVLRVVAEKDDWASFIERLTEHALEEYNVALPTSLGDVAYRRDPSEASRLLLQYLGEDKAVLSAYRIAELTQSSVNENGSERDEKPGTELTPESPEDSERQLQNRESEDASTQTVLGDARSSIERDAVEDFGVATPIPVGQNDPEPQPDGPIGDSDSDTDSGYYSEDGGRPGTPIEGGFRESSSCESGGCADLAEAENSARSGDGHRGDSDGRSDDQESLDGDVLVNPADSGPHMRKCFERQAMMLTGALKEATSTAQESLPLSVDNVQLLLERFVFNPDRRVPAEHLEVRYNFYPPFLTPKAIANYHIFAVTASIPLSCKANRSGSTLLSKVRENPYFKRLPKWRLGVEIEDALGTEVTPITELEENGKLIPLREDVSRLQWGKMRGEHIQFFSYPSLHMPPKISRMLMETLLQPFADENNKAEEPEPCISDEELLHIIDPLQKLRGEEAARAIERRRATVTMAVRYTVALELMERVFREPSMVKKIQEVLHHTLHHGFVALVRETAKVNLSNYATFHGITYNNPLNNCVLSKLLEGADKEDFVVDSIYLFLVLTWQTAMGMWQQAVDDTTVRVYAEVFAKEKRRLYAMSSVTAVSKAIVDILMDGDRLTEEMRKALPNFTCQSQISAFRHFLMERSNIPIVAAPFLPSDFVPLTFRQSVPLLWDQVYLLQLAFFLTAHGGYLWEPSEEEARHPFHRTYCPCNLCSPHRMPSHNTALHNEILAIGTFEIRSPDGKTFKLTPELWTNAYLDKFVPADFHPFTVFHYPENSSRFSQDTKACVTHSPEILSLIRQIQSSREEFLLTKGKGVYKDPSTGETLSRQPAEPNDPQHAGVGQALPTSRAYTGGGTNPASKTAGTVRSSSDTEHGQFILPKAPLRHGSKDVRREEQSFRTSGRRRLGRRNLRQSGHERPERRVGGRGGGGTLRSERERTPSPERETENPPTPRRILYRTQHGEEGETRP